MNIDKALSYIQDNLNSRLSPSFVSKPYTPQEKTSLLAGIKLALLHSERELTKEHIMAIFNTMNPEVRANMQFPLRKGCVGFALNRNVTVEALTQALNDLKVPQEELSYSPFFQFHGMRENNNFKSSAQMRETLGFKSNQQVAMFMFQMIAAKGVITYHPPYDSVNHLIDTARLTDDDKAFLAEYGTRLSQLKSYNGIELKFETLINEFNAIEKPTLHDIARFIKNMLLLHPFCDGNGRTFTLGVLNQLLVKHKFGICINMDPKIALSLVDDIVKAIQDHLVPLEQFNDLDYVGTASASSTTTSSATTSTATTRSPSLSSVETLSEAVRNMLAPGSPMLFYHFPTKDESGAVLPESDLAP